MIDNRLEVGILGATGAVGQKLVALLARHPWLEVTAVAASHRSAGRRYGEAVHWLEAAPLPAEVAALPVARGRAAARVRPRHLGARRRRGARDRAGVRRRRLPGVLQRLGAPHAPRRAAAGARGQRRPPAPGRAAADRAGVHRHQPQLLDGRPRARAQAARRRVRPRRRAGDDDAGGLRRRLPGGLGARHPRQRDPAHRRRGGEAREPSRARSSARSRAAASRSTR